ncbi:MAG: DUF1926 domain-containing protein [Chitinivibrionales bacterium]|nr:DUF1926 domain-containing protein [Chitinivibrionales bacterium]
MNRHTIAFLLRPYKNALLPRSDLKRAVNSFAERLINLSSGNENLRINCAIPAYILELVDPLHLVQLRELSACRRLEWLSCGYTEPFLSFSPRNLSKDNIRHGLDVYEDLLEVRPGGFIPSFSNWEPSFIDIFKEVGIQYMVLSRAVFPEKYQNRLGYWITEQSGVPMPLFPVTIFRHASVPRDIASWIREAYDNDETGEGTTPFLCIDYLIPLFDENDESLEWLVSAADALDGVLSECRLSLLGEYLSDNPPLGLQYIPPSLVFKRDDPDSVRYFLNYLHAFDQVGAIQRKMMDVCNSVYSRNNPQWIKPLKKKLFYIQDVNRYLPADASGFKKMDDRMWCYGSMIEIESELHKRDKIQSGQIRIADFLKDGSKVIVMANRPCKAYIDHKNGGHVFELDYRYRRQNLCATFNPGRNEIPKIVMPCRSRTSFVDHILDSKIGMKKYCDGRYIERGDFCNGHYDYKVKKTAHAVKTVLVRTGSISIQESKSFPLNIEKVFGFERDIATFSFVYQLSSHSLLAHSFRLAIELNLMIPGIDSGDARICGEERKSRSLTRNRVSFPQVTKWRIEDGATGTKLQFVTQKPVDIWCFSGDNNDPVYNGTTLVVSSAVELQENALWSLIGRIECAKIPVKRKETDAV